MAEFPLPIFPLFRGRAVDSGALPPAYVPVWFAITAPPPALLDLVGVAALAARVQHRPGAWRRHPRVRFEILALACYGLPVLAAILPGSTLYNDWRHLYFLHVPFCVLAIDGLHALATVARRGRRDVRLGGGRRGRAAGCDGIPPSPSASLFQRSHEPRDAGAAHPVRLDYWGVTHRQALEFLLAQYSGRALSIRRRGPGWNRVILPAADRQRVVFTDTGHADFLIIHPHEWMGVRARHSCAKGVWQYHNDRGRDQSGAGGGRDRGSLPRLGPPVLLLSATALTSIWMNTR